MSKIIDFAPARSGQDDAIELERTADFFMVAQQLSDYIKALPLGQPENDRLISLIIDQVQAAEHGAFAQGFRMGAEFAGYAPEPTPGDTTLKS